MLFSKTHLLRLHLPTEYKGDIHSCASVTTLDTGSTCQASRKVCVIENYFSISQPKHVIIETVLLSTQNSCLIDV